MSTVSLDAGPSVSMHYSVTRAAMDANSPEGSSTNAVQSTSVLSSLGWHSTRATAMNSSGVRGSTWRDVASFSSHPSPSLTNSVTGGEGVSPTDTTRLTAPQTPSDVASVTTLVSVSQHGALGRGVYGFRDFVSHLPKAPHIGAAAAGAGAAVSSAGETESRRDSVDPTSLNATTRPPQSTAVSTLVRAAPGSSRALQSPASQSTATPSAAQTVPLPASTVPAHRIRTVSHTERSASPSPVVPSVSDAADPALSHRVSITADTPKVADAPQGLMQLQPQESGFVIVATRRREPELRIVTDARPSEGDEGRLATATPSVPYSASSPSSFPSNPLRESVSMAPRDSDSSDSASALQAREAFQRYLDETRRTVLSEQTSEDERVQALDDLVTRSRELFDMLNTMHSSLSENAERRRYPMLKVVPYDGVSTSSTTVTSMSAPVWAAAGSSVSPLDTAAATIVSVSSDDGVVSGALEPLSLTTRTYATQLPPLGPTAALRLLGGIERGRRSSFNSCSSTSAVYMDVVNNYCITRLIGIGATGRAYLALDRKTNTYYAMKTVARHTRRSAARHLLPRPPSSLSEGSVMEATAPVSAVPDSAIKGPPRYVSGPSSVGAAPAPVTSADGTTPGSITRTTCFPAAAVHSARPAAGTAEGELREVDMEDLAQSASHASGIVIPYVESVGTAESSSASARDAPFRENGMEAVMMEDLFSRPSPVRASNSFARKFTDNVRAASHGTRPPMAPSAIRTAAPGVTAAAKDRAAAAATPAEADLSAVEREIRVMRRLQNHPHVVQLKEVIDDDEDDCAHMIMTYAANGPLTMVRGYDPAVGAASCNVVRPFPRCARLLRQLGEALIYVHRQRIVHNDVKPDNILLTEADNVLLTDFGESVLIPKRMQGSAAPTPQQPHSPRVENLNATVVVPHNRWKTPRVSGDSWMGGAGDFTEHSASYRQFGNNGGGSVFGANMNGASQMMMTEVSFRPDSSMFLAAGVDGDGKLNGDRVVVGTPAFAAPELIDSSTCSCKSDTWSFGVVMYAIVFGRLPFAGATISETFDEILHAPLSFPPLEAVPQREDLTEAAYDQWVLLCSKLLVREPQQRLSLSAILRHPLFRAAVPSPTSAKAAGGEAGSANRRSATSRVTTPDSATGPRWTGQRRSSPLLDELHDDMPPISRTTRAKSTTGSRSPPWSTGNETASRSGSPTLSCGRATPEGREVSSPPAPSFSPSSPGQSDATALPHVPSALTAAGLFTVPTPPVIPVDRSSPSSSQQQQQQQQRTSRTPSKQDEDSLSTLAPVNQNSFTQLPSLPPPSLPPPKALETLPPSCSSNGEDDSSSLPNPPAHLQDKTLVYYQGSDLGSSGRTISPKEGSLVSASNRIFGDYRRGLSWQTPMSNALMVDCAVVLPTSTRPDASTNGATASSTQTSEREEMRRLGLSSRESRAHSHSGSEECGGTGGNTGGTGGTGAPSGGATSGPPPTAESSLMHESDSGGDAAEHAAGDRSVGGATRRPRDDQASSTNPDDAASHHEEATDYYSYWNDSEDDSDESSSGNSGTEARGEAKTVRLVLASRNPAHLPPDSAVSAGAPPRRSLVTAKPKAVPVLSNHEEVLGAHRKRLKGSVVRTKRERGSTAREERRPSTLPAPRDSEAPAAAAASAAGVVASESVREETRRGSVPKRHSARCTSKATAPPGEKRHNTTPPVRESQKDERTAKQPPSSTSRSWFRRRH